MTRVLLLLVALAIVCDAGARKAVHDPIRDENGNAGAPVCDDGHPADVVFVLDASNSIWRPDFKKQLRFVREVVRLFSITSDHIHVGVITYADHPQLQFDLSYYDTKSDVIAAIDSIHQQGGYHTQTADALRYLRERCLVTSPLGSARVNVTHIAVVITDGNSDNTIQTEEEARLTRDAGVHIFAVGVGLQIDQRELRSIASSPPEDYTFMVESYEALSRIQELLAIKACSVTDPPTTTSTTTTSTTTTPTTPSQGDDQSEIGRHPGNLGKGRNWTTSYKKTMKDRIISRRKNATSATNGSGDIWKGDKDNAGNMNNGYNNKNKGNENKGNDNKGNGDKENDNKGSGKKENDNKGNGRGTNNKGNENKGNGKIGSVDNYHGNYRHGIHRHGNNKKRHGIHENGGEEQEEHGNDGTNLNGNDSHGKNGHGDEVSGNNGHGDHGHGDERGGNNGHGNNRHGDERNGNNGHGNNGHGNNGHGNNEHGNNGHGDEGNGSDGHGNNGHGNGGHGNEGNGNDGHGNSGRVNGGNGNGGRGNGGHDNSGHGNGRNGNGNSELGNRGNGNDGHGNGESDNVRNGNGGHGNGGHGNGGHGNGENDNDGHGNNEKSGVVRNGNKNNGNDGKGISGGVVDGENNGNENDHSNNKNDLDGKGDGDVEKESPDWKERNNGVDRARIGIEYEIFNGRNKKNETRGGSHQRTTLASNTQDGTVLEVDINDAGTGDEEVDKPEMELMRRDKKWFWGYDENGKAKWYLNGEKAEEDEAPNHYEVCRPSVPIDIVFVLDSKSRLGSSSGQFWDLVGQISSHIDMTPRGRVRIKFVKSCSKLGGRFPTNNHDKARLLSALDGFGRSSNPPRKSTSEMLSSMTSKLGSKLPGTRDERRKIGVYITDGRSDSASLVQTLGAAQQAKLDNHIELFAVGLGPETSPVELRAIASCDDRTHVIKVPDQSNSNFMDHVAKQIAISICSVR